ncbi:MAG TPA: diguanylate cyclase [Thermoanaerobaculia bacterium]|jgi:diguanylate cyclase (GGDEF)-like protein|nr:diguanylate cyclase [Thermoanaerobaculia bacterium]
MLSSPARRRRLDHEQPIDPPSVRVLIVDDDENFRVWLMRLVHRLGFVVESAVDGEHALSILRQSAFDLLISDYQMPRIDGFDLIRAVRADPALANQYSVMLTAREDLESKVTALTLGYDDFLPKSCTEAEVVAKVGAAKRVVSRQRSLVNAAREWQVLATRDELTGVATRRTLIEEAERVLREGRRLGIAIIDIDDFKPINDTFGHLIGDRILRELGSLFRSRTRANDLIARYGGDEFVLLVPNLPLEDLSGAAARLTGEIAAQQWTVGEATFGVTATSGLAHSSLLENATLEQLLDVADRDLYAKKWLKKHPNERPELYEYPGHMNGGALVPIHQPNPIPLPRAAKEET